MSSVDDIITELRANASWYEQNSNYNDTTMTYVFQKISEIKRNVFATLKTNFSFTVGEAYVMDISPVLRYGALPCSAPGKEAYMDSEVSCALFQLPYFLENFQFGYLCSVVIIPIILISILGKIKESYRWFLLNQAIWDAFMCYSFICEKPTVLLWSGGSSGKYLTCFYSQASTNPFLDAIFTILKGSFRNAPYIPLFLLAFSRCVALYFPKFYQSNNKTWKILIFIGSFNATIMILSSFPKLLANFIQYLKTVSHQNCFNTLCLEFQNYTAQNSKCYIQNEKYFQCYNRMDVFYENFRINSRYSQISITPVMFILVIICVILLFTKISWQLKYQLKHNRAAFSKTLKVAGIIFFQSITLTFYLLITALQTYFQLKAGLSDYVIDMTVYQKISPSIFLLQHYATSTSINIIRIFVDSFIVIAVLPGYRDRILRFFGFIHFYIRKLFQKSNNNGQTATPTTIIMKTVK